MRNKSELRGAVLDYLEAANDPQALALFDTWVDLAEADLSTRLRGWFMIRTATDTWTTNTGSAPEGCVQILQFTGNGLPYDQIAVTQADAFYTGRWFKQIGDFIRVYPAPTAASPLSIVIDYYLMDHIGDQDTDTSEILYHAPDCLLFGTLQQAAVFYGDDANLVKWTAALDRAIAAQNDAAYTAQAGNGVVSVRRK